MTRLRTFPALSDRDAPVPGAVPLPGSNRGTLARVRNVRVVAAGWCLATLTACVPSPVPPPEPAPTPSLAGTPAPSPATVLDLTAPGAARPALDRLVAAAGSDLVLMVSLTRTDAAVTVLKNGAAETWALRGGDPRRVESDTTYVSQATFALDRFNLTDVGALLRTAAAVSGSDQRQELQIVDYSAGLVMITVSTNPESRTVFFNPDGTLLPTLDLDAVWGLQQGFSDAVGLRKAVHAVGFGSQVGVYADVPGAQSHAIVRRQRTARVPVVVTSRTDPNPPPTFDPSRVDPAVVWGVLTAARRQDGGASGQEWSCVVDQRDRTTLRMHFQVGTQRFTTDLAGHRVAD